MGLGKVLHADDEEGEEEKGGEERHGVSGWVMGLMEGLEKEIWG